MALRPSRGRSGMASEVTGVRWPDDVLEQRLQALNHGFPEQRPQVDPNQALRDIIQSLSSHCSIDRGAGEEAPDPNSRGLSNVDGTPEDGRERGDALREDEGVTAEDEEINEEEEEGKPGGSALGPRGVDGEAGIPLSPREVEEEGRIGAKGGRGVLRRLLEGTWLSWRAPGHSLPRGEEVEGWTEGGWGFLPPDVLEAVVAAVPPRQLPRARLACRSWSKAAAAGTVPPIAPLSLDPLRLVRLPSLFPFAREIDLAARCACPLPSPPEASAALLSPLLLLPPLLRISFPPGSPLGPSLLRLVKAAMSYRGNEKEADKETRIINARACCWAGGGDCLIAEETNAVRSSAETHLDLSRCGLLDAEGLNHVFVALPGITSLDLEGCADLQPRALRALSSLTALRLLRLANCHLLDSDPRSHLEVPPGDDALSSISSHGHGLESLDLSGLRRLCDQPLRRLERLTSLVTLHLEGCVGVGRTNEPLGALPTSLTRLCLARCPQLRTGSLANLTSLPSLTALDLRECCGLCDLGRLAACVSLVELDASGCSGLQGAGGLPDLVVLPLRHLKLRGCRHLSDIGFGAVGKLRDLQLLDLGDCPQFTDMAAMELRHLAALTDLDVSGCIQLTNGALSGLTSCRALTRLRAAGCPHLTDTGLAPVVASAFASLTSLDVSGLHRLQGASLSPLMSASRLRTLRLEGCCSLQDFHLRALLPFPSLASLSLAGSTALTDASLAALTALESLSDLSLSRCPQVTGSWLVSPGPSLPRTLRTLSLSGCTAYGDGGLVAIASLASLTSLDLTGCWRLTDAALAVPLSRIPLLTSLGLSGLPWLSTAAASAASRLPHLRRLDLSGCNGLSDGDVALLSAGSLRELCLSGCQRLTAEGLRPLRAIGCSIQRLDLGRSLHLPASGAKYLDRLGALTYLSLEAWIKLSDAALYEALSAHGGMPLLQELNLSGCTLLTDATAEALATLSFPSLRRLEMIGCTSLEDEGVRLLAEGLPTLQALDISSCRLLTDVGLRWIGEGMGNLEVLGVAFCYEVTDMGLAALSGMPLLQELDVTGCCSVTAAACDVLQHTSNVHVTVRWSRERTAAEEAKNSFSFALIPLV